MLFYEFFFFLVLSFIASLSFLFSLNKKHFIVLPRMQEYYTLDSVKFSPCSESQQTNAWQESIKITNPNRVSQFQITLLSFFLSSHHKHRHTDKRITSKVILAEQRILPIIWLKFLCHFTSSLSLSSSCALQTTERTHFSVILQGRCNYGKPQQKTDNISFLPAYVEEGRLSGPLRQLLRAELKLWDRFFTAQPALEHNYISFGY